MALRSSQSSITQQVILEWIEKGKSPSSMIGNVERLGDAIKSLNAKALNSILAEYNKRVKVAQERASTPSERLAAPGQAWGAMTGGGAKKYAGKTIEQLVAKTQEQYAGYERFFRMVESGTKKYMKDWDSAIKEDHRRTQQMIKNGQMVARANQENLKFDEKAQQAVLTGAQKRFAFQENLQRQGARQEADRQAAFRQEQLRQGAIQKYGQMMAYAQQQNIKMDEATQKSIMRNARKRAQFEQGLDRQRLAEMKVLNEAYAENAKRNKAAFDKTPLGQLTNQWQKFGTVFRRVVDALGSFLIINKIASAVQYMVTSLFTSNAQLEVLDARLSKLMRTGGSFESLRKSIIDLTVQTPFVIADFTEAAAKLEAFGISAQKYLPAIADWSAAMGRDIQDMAVAFGKIANYSPRTAMLLGTRGIPQQEFRAELERTGSAAEALANIIERQFGGVAKSVSQTFTGLISNVKDMWFIISSMLGRGIFLKLRNDIKMLYDVLDNIRNAKDVPIVLSAISNALAQTYSLLKGGVVGLGILGGVKYWGQAVKWFSQLSAQLKMVVGLAGRVFVLTSIASMISEVVIAQQQLARSEVELKKVFGDGTVSIEKQIEALREYQAALENWRNSIPTLSFFMDFAKTLRKTSEESIGGMFGEVAGEIAEWGSQLATGTRWLDLIGKKLDKDTESAKRFQEELERIRQIQRAIVEIHASAPTPADIFNFRKEMEDAEGYSAFVKRIQDELAKFASTRPVVAHDTVQTATGLSSRELAAQVEMFDLLTKLGLSTEETRQALMKSMYEDMPRRIGEAVKGGNLQEFWEWVKDMAPLFTKADKAVKSYGDEIAELKKRISEFDAGESVYASRVAGSSIRIAALTKVVAEERKKGLVDTKNELDLVTEEWQKRQDIAHINDKVMQAELRLAEARRNLAQEEASLAQQRAEYVYQATGNLAEYNRQNRASLRDNQDQIELLREQISSWEKYLETVSKRKDVGGIIEKVSVQEFSKTALQLKKIPELTGEDRNRMEQWADSIRTASETYGVEEALIKAMIKRESNVGRLMESHAGAKGLMQLMPGTAKELGVTDRMDAYQNIMAGAKYIAQQLVEFGSLDKALAAYNAGPGGLRKALAGMPSEGFMKETVDYVHAIMKYYKELGGVMWNTAITTEALQGSMSALEDTWGKLAVEPKPAPGLKDQSKWILGEAKIAELRKEAVELASEQLNLMMKILQQVSEDFPAAFQKTFLQLRLELNTFFDEFTSMFVFGLKETTTGIIMDLLYGESGKSGLSEARYELASIRAEMSQAAYESSQIRRREGETNEEYAARMQLFEGAAASQQQMYVFKTQELEQMERINELERERNNLIYDRLRALGQKLTEKLMDYAIGSLMNMAFQGLSGPNYRDPGMVEAGYPGNNRPSSGGNTYVISGNTIYGMDDFDRKVGDSIRRIETRQRA